MKKQILLAVLSIFYLQVYCQTEKRKINSIGVSIPIIWNNSEAVYYILGNLRTPSGKSISNGININYSRTIYKNFYSIVGVGLFRQRFKIARPFEFETLLRFGFFTQKYSYDNLQLYGGVGYKQPLGKSLFLNGAIIINKFHSYSQKYNLLYLGVDSAQINRVSLNSGNSNDINLGFEKLFNKSFSIKLDLVLPIYIHWNDDKIFNEYTYSNNTQQIAQNKFSIGTSVSFKYNF